MKILNFVFNILASIFIAYSFRTFSWGEDFKKSVKYLSAGCLFGIIALIFGRMGERTGENMGTFLDVIYWVGIALFVLFVIGFMINFATDNQPSLILMATGILGICLGFYSGSMKMPVCSSCGTKMPNRRDVYCSVCGDIWDDNDLQYWQTIE